MLYICYIGGDCVPGGIFAKNAYDRHEACNTLEIIETKLNFAISIFFYYIRLTINNYNIFHLATPYIYQLCLHTISYSLLRTNGLG